MTIQEKDVLHFWYPRHNCEGMGDRKERRRIVVKRIRDCVTEPLERATIEQAPALRRGRFLSEAFDLDKLEERQFYFDSMDLFQER